jgi:hypothetical protein
VGHHVDGVDLAHRGGGGDLAHHLVGDAVGGLGPGVDDLVVLLALGDQAVGVLLLVLLGELAGLSTIGVFRSGMMMSSLPKLMPALALP